MTYYSDPNHNGESMNTPKLVTIYSLVQLQPGVNNIDFVGKAKTLEGVREAKVVLGQYDAIVVFEGKGEDFLELAGAPVKDLRLIDGVMRVDDVVCP